MALLSDTRSFDSLAGKRAKAAIESFKADKEGKTWTLLEACSAAELDYPVSEADLTTVFKVLDSHFIVHNLIDEPIWRQLMKVKDG